MKTGLVLCFLSICASLLADEEDCLCGTVANDHLYARAVLLLNLSIRHTPFDFGGDFPEASGEFYPPEELRASSEDSYPFEGRMRWRVLKSWHFGNGSVLNGKDGPDLYSLAPVDVPLKITRIIEWTDTPHDFAEYEHRENQVFDFQKNYPAIPQAFRALKNDIVSYCNKDKFFLDARIQDISHKVPVYEWCGWAERLTKKKTLLERKQKALLACYERLSFVEHKEALALIACTQSLDWCLANHHNPLAHVHRGLFYYLEGNTIEALDQVYAALEKMKADDCKKLTEDAVLLKAQTELEAGLYADAVLTLTELIKRHPANKEAYFERAGAYFELGDFDLSLKDYLASEVKPQMSLPDSIDMASFSLSLTKGILQGGAQAGIEFIPSLLSSLQGISHALWAFAEDPVQISMAFIQASQACISFVREHTSTETLTQLVPELKELIEKWDELASEKRGEITGYIIGKYGVDIFAGVGLTKAMQLYRELKKVNNLLTFEAMAISERNKSLISLEAARKAQIRKEIFTHANLKIQWDKQGKHVQGHVNFQASSKNSSILAHTDPQKLVNDFSGKGLKAGNVQPGTPGYQEIVDFKEVIGYSVDFET